MRRGLAVAASMVAAVSGCQPTSPGAVAPPASAEVYQALFEQFAFEGPGVFLVDPSVRGGATVAPIDSVALLHLRNAGMDVDRPLTESLARAFALTTSRVSVPTNDDRLREWDGRRPAVDSTTGSYVVYGGAATLVTLYPIGFSADGRRALTFVDLYCGPMECAVGFAVLLRREGTEWRLESQVAQWES